MSLLLSIISIPAAAAESKETEQVTTNDSVAAIEGKFPTTFDYSTSYTDEFGKEGTIQFTTVDGATFVEVYVGRWCTNSKSCFFSIYGCCCSY